MTDLIELGVFWGITGQSPIDCWPFRKIGRISTGSSTKLSTCAGAIFAPKEPRSFVAEHHRRGQWEYSDD
jgi:hypothetical protein